MEALKRVASDFADERPNDRIGLVRLKPIQNTTSDKGVVRPLKA
jgi:hypothetical protein